LGRFGKDRQGRKRAPGSKKVKAEEGNGKKRLKEKASPSE